MNTQPKALQLAHWLEHHGDDGFHPECAAELRRLHEANTELVKALEGVLEYDRCEIPIREYNAALVAIAKAKEQP